MKRFFIGIIAAAAALLCLVGCSKDEPDRPAPAVPPVETLKLDLGSIMTPTKSGDIDEYFTFATTQVLQNWYDIVTKIVCDPINGFQRVIEATPVYIGDGRWEWAVTYKDNFVTWTVSLLAKENKSTYDWELNVSRDGIMGYNSFCWITGWSDKDGKNGEWLVKAGPKDTDVLVKSAWASDNGKVTDVVVSYELDHLIFGIMPFFHGSYVEYHTYASDDAYDHSVNAHYNHMGLGFWDVKIEWNAQSSAGRVICNSKWHNGLWHCWDEHHADKKNQD